MDNIKKDKEWLAANKDSLTKEQQNQDSIEEMKSIKESADTNHELLKYEQVKYKHLFDSVPLGLVITDDNGHFIESNALALQWFKTTNPVQSSSKKNIFFCSPEGFIGQPITFSFPAETKITVRTIISELKNAKKNDVHAFDAIIGAKSYKISVSKINEHLVWMFHDETLYKEAVERVKELTKHIEERKFIERAKGVLMKQGDAEEVAFKRLQRMAMDRNIKMIEMSKLIIDADTLLSGGGNNG